MGQSAPLAPLTIVGPGFAGLNKQASTSLLSPAWAIEAKNCVFDDADRLASRLGWSAITGSALGGTPDIEQIFEYKPVGAANIIVSAANNKLYFGTTTLTDITGAVSVTANNWKFVNFNGLVYGLQTGHALISWNGTGNFANVTASSGTVPNGNELLGAFGRLWGVKSDGTTIQYSGLLDGAAWNAAGAGSINLLSVWPKADEIISLQAFNNLLVVFGRQHIVVIGDSTGSTVGINPAQMKVIDIIPGVGCIARDSVQNVNGDDIVFLSYAGIQSLNRVIQEKSNPLRNISNNVRDYLLGLVRAETINKIRSAFVPQQGFYLLALPTSGTIFCFSTKRILEDGTFRVTEWDNFTPRSLCALDDGVTLYGGHLGKIFSYSGLLDNGASYRYTYRSGWLDMGEEVASRLKILKRISSILYVSGSLNIIFKWAFDFKTTTYSQSVNTSAAIAGSEWGVGEYGLAEFGGSLGLVEYEIPASGSGQFIQIGVEADIDSDTLALQQTQLFAKAGRII